MNKKKGGGIGSKIIGWIGTLVMLGVVLAILQVTGISNAGESFKIAKDKAVEYSECIPSGECGILPMIEGLDLSVGNPFDFSGSDDSKEKGNSENEDNVVENEVVKGLPNKEGYNINLEGLLIERNLEGYKGPEEGEPYVNDLGLINKDSANSMLETLVVVKDSEDDNKDVGYSRAEWKHWSGTEGKSCWNTREVILERDAIEGSVKYVDKAKGVTTESKEACAIGIPVKDGDKIKIETENSGEWVLPYSGNKETTAGDIDIDHIIPLSNAARNGGQEWSAEKKEIFANDPDNLLATSAKENRSKGDKGPGKYMPPNKKYKCQYAKSFTAVAYKYDLSITESDEKELSKAIESCEN